MLWGKIRNAANTPKFSAAAATLNVAYTALYVNVTPNALRSKQLIGTFGANTIDMANTSVTNKGAHAGWNLIKRGTGGIASVAVNAPGGGYANGDLVTFGNGAVNATALITANATGNVTAVTLVTTGGGWVNASVVNTSITTSGGTGATFTVTVGGRAGRIMSETLVAAKSIA